MKRGNGLFCEGLVKLLPACDTFTICHVCIFIISGVKQLCVQTMALIYQSR